MIYEFFRWIGVLMGYPFKWLYFKNKIYYENEKAPRRVKGGALIITNHINPLDYVMNVFVFFPRKLYVVASEHAFKTWYLRAGMKFWGGIQANRETKSLRFIVESVRHLQKGHLVQIFPEGHNTDDGTIKEFYPSYILIALKSGAPIVPVITDGNYGFLKRVHLMVGEPIDLSQLGISGKPSKEEVTRINAVVRQKVLELRGQIDLRIDEERKGRGKN